MYGTDSVAPAAASFASRAAFMLGVTLVAPATRELRGSAGTLSVQPRIMQLLLELVDAGGAVVTRDVLALRCWNGRFVAEDSLNSAVAELRRALRSVSTGDISIETVPRTGYRFVGPEPVAVSASDPAGAVSAVIGSSPRLSRRVLVGGGLAAALVGGAALWRSLPDPASGKVATLIERGSQALRDGLPDADAQGVVFFKQAIALGPKNAEAWGKLALAWRGVAEYGEPGEAATAVANAQIAARQALALDTRQSDALTALATLAPIFGDWLAAERRIRDVLAIDPANIHAVGAHATLLMSTGQVRAAEFRLAWLVARDPLSANRQFRQVYCLWSLGRLAEMDRTADRALQLWPKHPAVWFARFWTLAFTHRAPAARAMLGDTAARPEVPPDAVAAMQTTLQALSTRAGADVRAAIASSLEAAPRGPAQAVNAIMVLSALGAVDAAFAVAEGLLMRRGRVVVQLRHTSAQPSITDLHHRITMMLWVPPTLALRADRNFMTLCRDVGLVDYWQRSRRQPDFLGGAPSPFEWPTQ